MREESLSTTVHLPAQDLWDYLADYDNVVRLGWDDASAQLIESPNSTERLYKAQTTWEGLKSTYTAVMDHSERPRTLTWSTKRGGTDSWVRFDLEPLDTSVTQVTVTLNLQHGSALRMLEPFAWGLLRPALVRTLSSLEHLELDAAPSETASDAQGAHQ